MKISEIVEQWFQANFHNNTYFQNELLFAQVKAAKADLLKRLDVGLSQSVEAMLEAEDPAAKSKK
jgi:hypothetical protein